MRHALLALALAALALGACASAPAVPSDSVPAVLSIHNMGCRECGPEVEHIALRQPGVRAAQFDPQKVELHLQLAPGTDPAQVAAVFHDKLLDGEKIDATVGPGAGSYTPFQPLNPAWDAKLLSKAGEDVPDLGAQLAPGKVNVVDFYADWCGPCHALDEHVHALLAKDSALAYRRLNMSDWDTPLAKHYLADARELPLVIVYDRKGKEVARFAGLHLDELDAAIAGAEK